MTEQKKQKIIKNLKERFPDDWESWWDDFQTDPEFLEELENLDEEVLNTTIRDVLEECNKNFKRIMRKEYCNMLEAYCATHKSILTKKAKEVKN